MVPYLILTLIEMCLRVCFLMDKNDIAHSCWDLPITFIANSQLAFITIKIDNLAEWRWTEVFWLFWIIFALFLAILIGLLLAMIVKIIGLVCYKQSGYQLKYYTSMVLMSISVLLVSVTLLLVAQEDFEKIYLGKCDVETFKLHKQLLIAANVVLLLFVASLLQWRSSVTRFLVEEIEFEINDENDEMQIGGFDTFRKGVFKVPLYLVRENSTFFRKKKAQQPQGTELPEVNGKKSTEVSMNNNTGANSNNESAVVNKYKLGMSHKKEILDRGDKQGSSTASTDKPTKKKLFSDENKGRGSRDKDGRILGFGVGSKKNVAAPHHASHNSMFVNRINTQEHKSDLNTSWNENRQEIEDKLDRSEFVPSSTRPNPQSHRTRGIGSSADLEAFISNRLAHKGKNTESFLTKNKHFDEQKVSDITLRIKGFNTVEDDGYKFMVGEYEQTNEEGNHNTDSQPNNLPGNTDHSDNRYDSGVENPPNVPRGSNQINSPKKGQPEETPVLAIDANDINEIKSFGEGGICSICFTFEPDAVYMNCGHGGLCYQCALEIWAKQGECYLCRAVSYYLQASRPNFEN